MPAGTVRPLAQTTFGERNTQNVMSGRMIALDPVQCRAQHERPDLQHPWLGLGQCFHPAGGLADIVLGDLRECPPR